MDLNVLADLRRVQFRNKTNSGLNWEQLEDINCRPGQPQSQFSFFIQAEHKYKTIPSTATEMLKTILITFAVVCSVYQLCGAGRIPGLKLPWQLNVTSKFSLIFC